jgi:hypothetical protein
MRRTSQVLTTFLFSLATISGALALPQESVDKSKGQGNTSDTPFSEQRVVEKNFPSASEASFKAVELRPISSPITLKQEADARQIYEEIGKQGELTVLFDYVSRAIRVDLQRVPLREALETVAFESKTFWRPVSSNTVFVAADTMAKRRELEQSIIKVFYLSQGQSATELQDASNMLRTILDVTRVQPLVQQHMVVMRGTPDQVSLAAKLMDDFVKAEPKLSRYRVEVRVSDMEGSSRLGSKTYTLFLQRNAPQQLNIVSLLPPQTDAQAALDKSKLKDDSRFYQTIDCSILAESADTVALSFAGTFSDFSLGENPRQPHGDNIRQVSISAKPVLTLDKPTIINSFDDPTGKRSIQVEVTVKRLGDAQ